MKEKEIKPFSFSSKVVFPNFSQSLSSASMISSTELESVRAVRDEIEAKFEGGSLGNKICSGEKLSCPISVPFLATFPKYPLSRLNRLKYR